MSKQKYPQASVSTTSTGEKVVRKGRENYSQSKAHVKNDRKRHEAYARQDKYDKLSTAEKLAQLPVGTCERQRLRLTKQLVKESPTPLVDAYKAEKAKAKKSVKK
jgi:hypothetical protein